MLVVHSSTLPSLYMCNIHKTPHVYYYMCNIFGTESKTTKYNSVTRMIHELGWKNLTYRISKDIRFTMPYNIINKIVKVSNNEILIPADTRT